MADRAGDDIAAWFAARVPGGWFSGPPEVSVDREEIVVVGAIAAPAGGGEVARAKAVKQHRDATRDARVRIAGEAEHLFERKVSWGVACGPHRYLFATLAVPVMTRLRMDERGVLDTLIDAGVARSRSEALAWCVRLVERHQGEWIEQLREALIAVERLRAEGPDC